MDPLPLTDDGYCGLKVVAKGERGGLSCTEEGWGNVVADLACRS